MRRRGYLGYYYYYNYLNNSNNIKNEILIQNCNNHFFFKKVEI